MEVENLMRRNIKILRSDNEGEYNDSKFHEFCNKSVDLLILEYLVVVPML